MKKNGRNENSADGKRHRVRTLKKWAALLRVYMRAEAGRREGFNLLTI